MRTGQEVVGQPSCEDHKAHVVGCLDCLAEVAVLYDDLDEYVDHAEEIGWQRPEGF